MAELTRIVIVDDHPFVREGLKQLLAGQNEFQLAGEASSIADARTAIASQNPDVAVVDLALGADDGVDLAGREHAMHRCERLRVQVMRQEFGYGNAFQILGAAAADAAIREQHAQTPVEHEHIVGNRRDELAQLLARPGCRGGQVARGGGGRDRGFFRRNAQRGLHRRS